MSTVYRAARGLYGTSWIIWIGWHMIYGTAFAVVRSVLKC